MKQVAYILAPVEFGGAERVSLNFLEHNDRTRWQITPIVFVRPWERENVFINHLDRLNYPYCKVPVAVRPPAEGRDYLRVLRAFKIVHSLLKGGSYDLVHTHGYFADIVGIPISRWLQIPVVTTCHGYINSPKRISFINAYNAADRLMVRFSSKVIAVSESLRETLTRSGIRREKVCLVTNCVHVETDIAQEGQDRMAVRERLDVADKECVIGFIGRLSREKGFPYLLEAAATLRKENIPVTLLILGDGPQADEMTNRARELGLNGRCHFVGFQKEVRRWIPAMDVFVLPSLTEGTPMALLEAMSCGKPVVATNVGGVPQVVQDGVNGVLVPPGDTAAIKSAILTILGDSGFESRLKEESRKTIRSSFNLADWMKTIYSIYHDAIERG